MPPLKHINCHVQVHNTTTPFKEYGIEYKDGFVSCYCLVPNSRTELSIILETQEYIAPRIAVIVSIDGKYQVNQSKRMFRIRTDGTCEILTNVTFNLIQKEAYKFNGTIVATPWILYPLAERGDGTVSTGTKSDAAEKCSTIEVSVLRCGHEDIVESATPFVLMPQRKVTGPSAWQKAIDSRNSKAQASGYSHILKRPGLGSNYPEAPFRRPFIPARIKRAIETMEWVQDLWNYDPEHWVQNLAKASGYVLDDSDGYVPGPESLGTEKPGKPDPPSEKIKQILQRVNDATSSLTNKPSHSMVRGPKYEHVRNIAVPNYIDSMDKPYAKFVFHYRDRDALSNCPGIATDFTYEDALEEFKGKTKEEIIAELVAQRKTGTSHRDSHKDSQPTTTDDSSKIDKEFDDWNNPTKTTSEPTANTDADKGASNDAWDQPTNNNWGGDSNETWDAAGQENKSDSGHDDQAEPSSGGDNIDETTSQTANTQEHPKDSTTNNDTKSSADIESKIAALGAPPPNPDDYSVDAWLMSVQMYNKLIDKRNSYEEKVAKIKAGSTANTETTKDAVVPDNTNTEWSPEPIKASGSKTPWYPGSNSKADKQSELSYNTFASVLLIYMVQVPDRSTPSTTRIGEEAAASSQSNASPAITTNTAAAPVRRRARAESFYTSQSPAELLLEDNTQPGYGAITAFERAMAQRDQRNRRLLSTPSVAITTAQHFVPIPISNPQDSLPPNPHLEQFPDFNPPPIPSAPIAPPPSPPTDTSPERGRTMRRRCDTFTNNSTIPLTSSFSFSTPSSSTSSSSSSSSTIRPGQRTPTQRDFLSSSPVALTPDSSSSADHEGDLTSTSPVRSRDALTVENLARLPSVTNAPDATATSARGNGEEESLED